MKPPLLSILLALVSSVLPTMADSPEEAVARVAAACKAGDTVALTREFPEPLGPAVREWAEAIKKARDAEEEYRQAVLKTFGQDQDINFDWMEWREAYQGWEKFMKLTADIVLDKKEPERDKFRLHVSVPGDPKGADPSKRLSSDWIALQQGGAWRIAPEGMDKHMEATKAEVKKANDHAPICSRLAKDVLDGKYKRVGEVWTAHQEALDSLLSDSARALKVLSLLQSAQLARSSEWSRDEGASPPFWTRDVAGLFFHHDAAGGNGGGPYISSEIAHADRLGLATWSKDEPKPFHGYWVRAMVKDATGAPYRAKTADGKEGDSNLRDYAFCVYPADHGRNKPTYIFSWSIHGKRSGYFGKDLGAAATEGVADWPGADPTKSGWEEVQ